MENLLGFRGSIEHTLRFERKIARENRDAGAPYVLDSTMCGIQFDGGFDMARTPYYEVEEAFAVHLEQEEMLQIRNCSGMAGEVAFTMLKINPTLSDIRITEQAARDAMNLTLAHSWKKIAMRWPNIRDKDTPEQVQESVLDLVFCRGIMNGHVKTISLALKRGKWEMVGDLMADMQQRSRDLLTVKRRKFFADNILSLYAPDPPEAD